MKKIIGFIIILMIVSLTSCSSDQIMATGSLLEGLGSGAESVLGGAADLQGSKQQSASVCDHGYGRWCHLRHSTSVGNSCDCDGRRPHRGVAR